MALVKNKITGEWEETDNQAANEALRKFQSKPEEALLPNSPMRPDYMPQEPKPIDPVVKEYLLKKSPPRAPAVEVVPKLSDYELFRKQFDDGDKKKALIESERQKEGLGWSQFAAGMGEALAGRGPSESAKSFEGIRKGIDDSTIGAEEKNRKEMIDNFMKQKDFDARAADRRDNREDRKYLHGIARTDKLRKDDELNSVQAKQLGLYKIGKEAEDQYNRAVADKEEYDPTSSGQWIDNSQWAPNLIKNNKAAESQAAQSSWVESFLRDASGATIQPSERMSYAIDYFPQPGDTAEIVKNKAALRKQKMENSLIGAGPGAKTLNKEGPPKAPPSNAEKPKWAQ